VKVSRDEVFARAKYFLERVIPVAAATGRGAVQTPLSILHQ
jgi:D-mannonate dehydratase